MKKLTLIVLFISIFAAFTTNAQVQHKIDIPNIEGYLTLQCDFHMHTVFSDGLVWPTIRTDEAWREGLDAISITDHIEYQPHKDDIPTNHNRSYDIAKPSAEAQNILLIKGTEVTRRMPPGHLNALFVSDVNPMDTEDWRTSLQNAIEQDAFVFWNHPGWWSQQPDTTKWWDEHTEILEKGWMHGIEVVNYKEYYPEVHQWCLDHNLTMLGNSDLHNPVAMDYDPMFGEHRPITLVFAKERTNEGIKEALMNQRTAVYFNDLLIGREQELRELFNSCVSVKTIDKAEDGSWVSIEITNNSDLPVKLRKNNIDKNLKFPHEVNLKPKEISKIYIRINEPKDTIAVSFIVDNFLHKPNSGLLVSFEC